MIQRSICKAARSGPAAMGRARPVGLAGNFVIPGVRKASWRRFSLSLSSFILLCWVFICCAWAFSICGEQRLLFIGMWWLLLWSTGFRRTDFGSCRSRVHTSGSITLWCVDSVALQHVESSRTRNRTRVPCIDRRILNHWTTGDIHKWLFTFMMIHFFQISPQAY